MVSNFRSFEVSNFHGRCDGHTNTLTVIFDTEGNIFGGFTPVEWDSRFHYGRDDSLKSFVFTLKNPHNIPARKFVLNAKKSNQAIYCIRGYTVQSLVIVILLFPITATQTPTVLLALIAVTQTISDWPGKRF
jgi:hypothetical protein